MPTKKRQQRKEKAPKVVQIAFNHLGWPHLLYDNGRVFAWMHVPDKSDTPLGSLGWFELPLPDLTIPHPPKGYRANG